MASTNSLRLARQLFTEEAERAAFLTALETPLPYQPAVVWLRQRPEEMPFACAPRPAWLPEWVDLASPGERPGQHPLHHEGAYYCLDASSVFAASVLCTVPVEPDAVLDVCASPGGKSVFAWRALRPRLLVANEVIGKRTGPLIGNLQRCRISPSMVTSADSAVLAQVCLHSADVVIVDAPCSGQSLLAKGEQNPGCCHPATINLNANRQRRILANAAATVAPGGWMAYITCTYAEKENEGNVRWFLRQFRMFTPVAVAALEAHRSTLAEFPCYRLWPQGGVGAGAFAALLRRDESGSRGSMDGLRPAWRPD